MPHLWPTGSSSGQPPLITARYFSSCPSDSTSRWTPCPPESYQLLSGQRGITPAFGYDAPHPSARGTLTLLNNVLLSTQYEPVRLPPPATPGLWIPLKRWPLLADHQGGSPRFLCRSFLARRPQPPRRAQRLLAPIASPSVAGFVRSGSLAALSLLNEAESGSLALRLTSSPSPGFVRRIAPPPAGSATC